MSFFFLFSVRHTGLDSNVLMDDPCPSKKSLRMLHIAILCRGEIRCALWRGPVRAVLQMIAQTPSYERYPPREDRHGAPFPIPISIFFLLLTLESHKPENFDGLQMKDLSSWEDLQAPDRGRYVGSADREKIGRVSLVLLSFLDNEYR